MRHLIIIGAVILAAAALAMLTGCQTYQPPGQDLWRAL